MPQKQKMSSRSSPLHRQPQLSLPQPMQNRKKKRRSRMHRSLLHPVMPDIRNARLPQLRIPAIRLPVQCCVLMQNELTICLTWSAKRLSLKHPLTRVQWNSMSCMHFSKMPTVSIKTESASFWISSPHILKNFSRVRI